MNKELLIKNIYGVECPSELSIWSTDAEVLFRAGANMFKNPGDAGASPALLSQTDSLIYLSSATSHQREFNQ